ncbi:MAG: DNA integrity scanning diadenylate cyclase DisA [Propionibacteriaceae bacterium]|nr:DNA integrity scanning diadenylate cyclase DisA [Propionibacteriaceae bacterium]
MESEEQRLLRYVALVAPGTPLRLGLERILAGRTGALVILGTNRIVQASCSGGFPLNVEFTPTRLRELAKMDGAIVLSNDLSTILAAGVHVVSDPVPTEETGTRHRSADQLAKVSGIPVITVSASMSAISLFIGGRRHSVDPPQQILQRANQALATLSRYRERLDAVLTTLTALEVRDQVSLRDLAAVVRRVELIRRLTEEVRGYVLALGVDGRLLALQLTELNQGIEDLPGLLSADYAPEGGCLRFERLGDLADAELLDVAATARALGLSGSAQPDYRLSAHGYRVLGGVPRLPHALAEKLIVAFGGLQGLFGASVSDLQQLDGIGSGRARAVRDHLLRLSEAVYHG